MTTLSQDASRVYELGDRNHIGVIAADIIFEGAAVGDNASGFARPLVGGDPFLGFAVEQVDNTAGAAGAKNIEVKTRGRIQLAIGSLAITDRGAAVYASDDDTFTLTRGTNTYIGRVVRFVSSGVGVVEFDVIGGGSASESNLVQLTNNAGDVTPDDTIADTSTVVTGVDGTGNNAASKADVDARLVAIDSNFSDLAAKLNALIAKVG